MATLARRMLEIRNDVPFGYVEQDGLNVPWWYSDTGIIVKWTIFVLIIVLILAWTVGGYLHAKSRIKKGLPPLRYHRCFVSRRVLARVDPNYAYPQPMYSNYANHQPNGYPMYNMPPPVYDPTRPPMYEPPPEGGSKADPAQGREAGPASYAPPPGPPPGPPPVMR